MGAAAAFTPDLLDRCIAGDRRAWSQLHREYRPVALTFLRRLGVGPRDLEDAGQEVFLQVFRYLATFERRADFRTWLYKLCISQAARVRRRAALLQPLVWLVGGEGASDPEWSQSRVAETVERALATLNDRQRAVFVLFELEGLSTDEVARTVGCPAATVRRQIQEARQKVERCLRDEPLEGKR
jgi:RNA polymerase sigma-70 factor (ECF subfamily)